MGAFSARQAIQPRWDPALQGRAVRLFVTLAVILAALALIGYVNLYWFSLHTNPLALLLAVIGPVLTALGLGVAALIVKFAVPVGQLIARIPLVIFLGGIVGAIMVVWAHGLLFAHVDSMIANQDERAAAQRTLFGGELTLPEIQQQLLTSSEQQANEAVTEADAVLPYPPGQGRLAWLAYGLWPLQFGLVRDLIGIAGVIGFVSVNAMFAIWWERKIAARIQSRLGPMRVGGWHGWAQSLADGIKLIQKEDIVLADADRPLYKLAPYIAFIPALSAFIALPFGAAWVFRELDVALIFILAMLGIEVVGVILAGWASNNKWSVYGAMREASQLVSYEVPLGLSLLVPIMTVGTLKLSDFGAIQAGGFHSWLAFATPFTFVAAVTYFIASLASCKRAPFDLPEAESELVSGYHTEYSGFRWSLFFFAEYASMFIVSGVGVILFFGAWNSPLPASWGASWASADAALWQQALHGVLFSSPIWFVFKAFFLVYVQIWIRWTLPRIRLDQVMYACVQVLIPLTMVVLLGNTFWLLWVSPESFLARIVNGVLTLVGTLVVLGYLATVWYGYSHNRRMTGRLAIDHLPGA